MKCTLKIAFETAYVDAFKWEVISPLHHCDDTFSWINDFEKHGMKHTGEKPYQNSTYDYPLNLNSDI